MCQILIIADEKFDNGGGLSRHKRVMHSERVNAEDFESDHFQAQLVERTGWAVTDAHEVEATTLARARGKGRFPFAARVDNGLTGLIA